MTRTSIRLYAGGPLARHPHINPKTTPQWQIDYPWWGAASSSGAVKAMHIAGESNHLFTEILPVEVEN